jgi:hypothetical protein
MQIGQERVYVSLHTDGCTPKSVKWLMPDSSYQSKIVNVPGDGDVPRPGPISDSRLKGSIVASFSQRDSRAGVEREGYVLRALIDYRPVAVQRLAWEERNRAWIAQVEQARLLQEAGIFTPSAFKPIRETFGAALVRCGEWLQNRSAKRRVTDAVSAL